MAGLARKVVADHISRRTRWRLTQYRHRLRIPTANWRSAPQFFVIGVQRGGTSSLFRLLANHPNVRRGLRKETEYFSRYYRRGDGWYRANFPLEITLRVHNQSTFEATPDYLYSPLAPERLTAAHPTAPLVVILRDPVARAWSHYQHMRRLGFEPLDFEEALYEEPRRIAGKAREYATDPAAVRAALWFSYLDRGRYVTQLERWLECIERHQLLIIFFEDLIRRPADTFANVCSHVGLEQQTLAVMPNASYPGGQRTALDQMPAGCQVLLEQELRPLDAALEQLIGRAVPWG